MKKDDIKALVIGIIEEYETNNPFLLAEYNDISVLYHDLPNTLDAYRLDNIIVLNTNLKYEKRKWVLAHELGHYFLHDNSKTLGNYIKNKMLIKAKCELEADTFATELLLSNIDEYVLEGLTLKQISSLLNVPEKYIQYKFKKEVI